MQKSLKYWEYNRVILENVVVEMNGYEIHQYIMQLNWKQKPAHLVNDAFDYSWVNESNSDNGEHNDDNDDDGSDNDDGITFQYKFIFVCNENSFFMIILFEMRQTRNTDNRERKIERKREREREIVSQYAE